MLSIGTEINKQTLCIILHYACVLQTPPCKYELGFCQWQKCCAERDYSFWQYKIYLDIHGGFLERECQVGGWKIVIFDDLGFYISGMFRDKA